MEGARSLTVRLASNGRDTEAGRPSPGGSGGGGSAEPAARLPGRARAVVDLPDPLSPTRPSRIPGWSVKLTSRMARTRRVGGPTSTQTLARVSTGSLIVRAG